MKILVLNCGSSSIKYQLYAMTEQKVLAKGIVDKVGLKGAYLKNERNDGDKAKLVGEILDHQAGIEYILGVLTSEKHGSLNHVNELAGIGHRVVHGGEKFQSSVLITDDIIQQLEELVSLAPLHNPPNLKGIYAMKSLLPRVPQVAVFDTAFHQTMPEHSYMYALPYSLCKKYGIRRYGFHGSSHRYISARACEILGVDIKTQKIITCHLGNGCSMAAIKYGQSIDTTMGFTPVEGLIMGTRAGDMDLGVLLFLMEKEELSFVSANTLINKHSGMLGISGISSDMREIENESLEGNERALLALDMFAYRIKKYIGAFAAAMNGFDILILTGGIGENGDKIRKNILSNLDYLGIEVDDQANSGTQGKEAVISKPSSKAKIMVVPTNEELIIALDTMKIIS